MGRLADRLAVDPERDVSRNARPFTSAQVDPPFHAVGERVERADHVMPVHPEVEAKWVRVPAGTQMKGRSCAAAAAATTAWDPSPPTVPRASAPSPIASSTCAGCHPVGTDCSIRGASLGVGDPDAYLP
jgi:Tfp pilus assembly protein FimV